MPDIKNIADKADLIINGYSGRPSFRRRGALRRGYVSPTTTWRWGSISMSWATATCATVMALPIIMSP